MHENKIELLWVLARTDFKLRYHGSLLGFLWVLLKPLSFFVVLNFVFTNIFSTRVEYYPLRLFTGIVLWNCFAECTMAGMTSLLAKAHLISNMNTPKWIVVTSSVLSSYATFIVNCFVLGAFFLFYGVFPSWISIVYYVFLISVLLLLVVSFSLLTAPVFLRVRDLNQIWEVGLLVLFYLTPVLYPLSILPEQVQTYFYFNPLTAIVEFSKQALIDGQSIPFSSNVALVAAIGGFSLVAILVFRKTSVRASEYV
jgi:ABC-type polysaccharide/polyol phosphate export permease